MSRISIRNLRSMVCARPNRRFMYIEDELLMLSGIQHIAFCERQWALIHIEQQWTENMLTVEGHHLHEKVDDPFEAEIRGNTAILRALPLVSLQLGFSGIADVVELTRSGDEAKNSISVSGREGRWLPTPVEYKRGKPKPDRCDDVQLCAQAMCLEEMYSITINKGYLYYGQTRHRHEVEFTDELRNNVISYSHRMHELFSKGITPPPVYKSQCRSCSLKDICLPKRLNNTYTVEQYLKEVFK